MKLQAELRELKIVSQSDESPDLSYLDQYKDAISKEEKAFYVADQKRKNKFYNGEVESLGISAKATIYLPFICYTGKGKEINYKIQTISSGGLWGIESDSDKSYIKETAEQQLDELKRYLKMLNVKCKGFKHLSKEALLKY